MNWKILLGAIGIVIFVAGFGIWSIEWSAGHPMVVMGLGLVLLLDFLHPAPSLPDEFLKCPLVAIVGQQPEFLAQRCGIVVDRRILTRVAIGIGIARVVVERVVIGGVIFLVVPHTDIDGQSTVAIAA